MSTQEAGPRRPASVVFPPRPVLAAKGRRARRSAASAYPHWFYLPAAIVFGVIAWALGALTIFAPRSAPWFDFASSDVALPLGALLLAVFAGWIVPRAIMRDELRNSSDGLFRFWRFMIRYVAPIAVFLILLLGLDAKFNFGLNAFIRSLAGG